MQEGEKERERKGEMEEDKEEERVKERERGEGDQTEGGREGGGNGVCLYTTLISIFFPTRNVFNSSET